MSTILNKKAVLLVCTLTGLFSCSGGDALPVLAQETAAARMRTLKLLIEDDLSQIRRDFRTVLNQREAGIERSIKLKVEPIDNPLLAYAVKDGTEREIHITVGFARMLQMIAHSLVIQQAYNKPGVSQRWMQYGLNEIAYNQNAARHGEPQRFIKSIYEYAGLTPLQVQKLSSDPVLREQYAAFYLGMLAFAYGHELGHHINGDTNTRWRNLAESRNREYLADDFSSGIFVRMGKLPFAACFSMAFFSLTETGGSEELSSTHPSPNKRARKILGACQNYLRAHSRELMAAGGNVASLQSQLATSIQQLDSEIAATE